MSNIVEFVTFKLKEGVSEQQLLAGSDELNANFLSLQKGYVSRKLLKQGDMWAELVQWESMEDAMKAVEAFEQSPAIGSYGVCIDESSCTMQHFAIVKNY